MATVLDSPAEGGSGFEAVKLDPLPVYDDDLKDKTQYLQREHNAKVKQRRSLSFRLNRRMGLSAIYATFDFNVIW